MKVVIPGGSGQVGTLLCRALAVKEHNVVVLSRKPQPARWSVVEWDGETLGDWASEIDGADVVINLAGQSVNCRYNKENQRLIKDSRVNSTRAVGKAIEQAARPPRVWLQASTATIYAHLIHGSNDDIDGKLGGTESDLPGKWRFSIDVANSWEQAANEAKTPKTRKVLLRSAMVLSPHKGGVFDVLLGLVRRGLGGRQGDGRQSVSWIHEKDFVRAVFWLIEHKELAGPVNVASPTPVPNAEFMRTLRKAWGSRFALPAPGLLLAIGALLMRTETELVLKSRRVVPRRLTESGFAFQFPTWSHAAEDLCRRWRNMNAKQREKA